MDNKEDIKFQPKQQAYSYSSVLGKNKNRLSIFITLLFMLIVIFIILSIIIAVLNYYKVLSIPGINQNKSIPSQQEKNNTLNKKDSLGSTVDDLSTEETTRFTQYPNPDGKSYVLSSQYPTIVGIEENSEEKTLLIGVTISGNNLTESKKNNLIIDNKNIDYFVYQGLTIWYTIDERTLVWERTPPGSKPEVVMVETKLNDLKNKLKVGDKLNQVVSQIDGGTEKDPDLNQRTLNLIKSSVGTQNVKDNKTFILYASEIALP